MLSPPSSMAFNCELGARRHAGKGLGQGSTLGWLDRRHGPILTTTLPVVPSPADLLVA